MKKYILTISAIFAVAISSAQSVVTMTDGKYFTGDREQQEQQMQLELFYYSQELHDALFKWDSSYKVPSAIYGHAVESVPWAPSDSSAKMFCFYQVSHPIDVYGVAVTTTYKLSQRLTLHIYQIRNGELAFLSSSSSLKQTNLFEYVFNYCISGSDFMNPAYWDTIPVTEYDTVPVFEYYFDSSVRLNDTFVVVGTLMDSTPLNACIDSCFYRVASSFTKQNNIFCGPASSPLEIMRYVLDKDSPLFGRHYGGFFPILMPDTSTTHATDTTDTLGVQTVMANNTITIHPNPTVGKFSVVAAEPIQSLEVYDPRGWLLQRMVCTDRKALMDISAEPSGCYIVRTRTASGVYHHKILKQ